MMNTGSLMGIHKGLGLMNSEKALKRSDGDSNNESRKYLQFDDNTYTRGRCGEVSPLPVLHYSPW